MKPEANRDDETKRKDPKPPNAKHEPSESAIDEAGEESFPASDPVSVSITKKK